LCVALLLFCGAWQDAAAKEALTKKEAYLAGKGAAPAMRAPKRRKLALKLARRVGKPPTPQLVLRNTWTDEILVLDANPRTKVDAATWDRFLRCHFTQETSRMDPRLLSIVVGAALKFRQHSISIVSAYRAPKYQLMLRKKGREVAKNSEHTEGTAIDFRIPGVPLRRLRAYLLRFHPGGVGYYPDSQFVHADTGPRRTWTGR
jgi:uncharacterized protein YcbK (DUF882 family)